MTQRTVELRSDTFTRPTEAMRRAMYEAEVGDDVWDEDPTVQRLEEQAAHLLGKEAGLFLSSGTQGNLVGVLSHTQQGQEVLVGDQSHIFHFEVAGLAVIGGLQLRTLKNNQGRVAPLEVAQAVRGDDIHEPKTGCLALENTHNRCGGAVLTKEDMAECADAAHASGIPVHLDGARIFNAVVALRTTAADLVAPVDSLMFDLAKGLGAPVGSVLCGAKEYIIRAKRWRKLLGGGMRQVGVLAAPAIVALNENIERLAEDHENARVLAEGLANISGLTIEPQNVDSNIVVFDVAGVGGNLHEFISGLNDFGVRVASVGPTTIRAVTSYEVSRSDIDYALEIILRTVGMPEAALA